MKPKWKICIGIVGFLVSAMIVVAILDDGGLHTESSNTLEGVQEVPSIVKAKDASFSQDAPIPWNQ